MNHTVSWFDRLRIERVVWSLDQQLYELPNRSRVATRREVRANLVAAARDIGTTAALRQLGTSSQLAHEYLSAELGDRPRHSWVNAALFLATTSLVLTSLLTSAANGFGAGILAAQPGATGTFHWAGIAYLQSSVTFAGDGGAGSVSGGAMTPLCYVLLLVGTVYVGKLWRLPALRRLSPARASRPANR